MTHLNLESKRPSLRSRFFRVLLLSAGSLVWGCGGYPCDGVEPKETSTSPVLSSVKYIGQLSPEYFPVESSDPYMLFFEMNYSDSDANLSSGTLDTYLGDSNTPVEQQNLSELFAQSGTSAAATKGSFWIALRFGSTLQDHSGVHLAWQLNDSKGEPSNCYQMDMSFRVTSP